MFATWIFISVSISLIVSVQPNRLPQHYPTLSPQDQNSLLFLTGSTSSASSSSTPGHNLGSSKPLFFPSPQILSPDNFPQSVLSSINQDITVENESVPLIITDPIDDDDYNLLREPPAKRRARNFDNENSSVDRRHHFDICVGRYDVKDLGHHFFPRFIETANCRNHLPPNVKDRIECIPIHYHVQVLTQRKDSDSEEVERTPPLPDHLKDWHFVHIPVNVGCHCTVTTETK